MRHPAWIAALLLSAGTAIAQTGPISGGGGGTGANPTATAGPAAVNGSATTFLRSDGAPAIQKGSASLFGIVEVDGTTITASGGVISSVGGAATTITPGTTTVVGATAPCLIDNSATTVMGCAALAPTLSLSAGTLSSVVPDTTHTTSVSVANAGGQDNYNGSSLTATGLGSPAANSTQFITDQASTALTIANNSVTVGGLPLSTTLHSYGFYGYTYNNSTSQWDAWGFPGFGTITTNAVPKFIDGSGATTASSVSDNGTTVSTAENVTLTGTTTDLTGTAVKVGTVNGQSNVQSGSTYTMVAGDCGKTVISTNAGAVTMTIPASIVPASGTACIINVLATQAAKVSVNGSAVSAATLISGHSYTGTSGSAGAMISLTLTTISAATDAFLTGDGS